jgi:2-C-methyl-D-erythritol 4-phosphate cytidylyltransferase/2-C-methyl-D-erythritol 2,4-cyclodiphosphate synthase
MSNASRRVLGARVPKAWVDLAGKPLFLHSLETFHGIPGTRRIVLVMEKSWITRARNLLRSRGVAGIRITAGGRRRQDSVLCGVRAVRPRGREVTLIHDCARPFVDTGVVRAVAAAAARHGAALAALPTRDTVKRSGADRRVSGTVPRAGLWRAQTPQAIRADQIPAWERAMAQGTVTDDVAPLEAMGCDIRLVPGSERTFKITVPADLAMARALARRPPEVRVGFGFDLHRLVPGRPLVLGGVRIPFRLGLSGHSDADIVCHALADAVMGALAAGDMGARFGIRRTATRGMASVRFLSAVAADAAQRGWWVNNADVTVLAEAPRIGPYRDRMTARLAAALGTDRSRVSVKATTAKRTGTIGRGEALAAFALVTVTR